MYRMDVELIGANANAEVVTEQKQDYYENYFNERTGEKGATAYTYNRVTYKNIYPHIDWVLYMKDGELEHEFLIHEGGNASDIQLKYGGATGLKINAGGSLTAATPQGTITEQAPKSYQPNGTPVKSGFKLNGDILSYKTGEFKGDLVIDPSLQWATYYGGSGWDEGVGIVSDAGGNVFITGLTESISSVATSGSFQATYAGSEDVFLAKFNSNGAIDWGTYYGGSGMDDAAGLSIDKSGNLYVSGTTGSTSGIASIGAYQTSLGGGQWDGFLAKFSNSGARIWSTYYGGPGTEVGTALATDTFGNTYITGETNNTTGIVYSDAYQTSIFGSYDLYLAKFDSAGSLKWGTVYGGSGIERPQGVATDDAGNIYLTGYTSSGGLYSSGGAGFATSGAFNTSGGPGASNSTYVGFLMKYTAAGSPSWATYYGGTGGNLQNQTNGMAVATDKSGNVYFTGMTAINNGIATSSSYQTTLGGGYDAFLAKFNNAGTIQWGTYYGGSGSDGGPPGENQGITTDATGNVYIVGSTSSTSGIATAGSYQDNLIGQQDGYLAQFNSTGSLIWATYYGTNNFSGNDGGTDGNGVTTDASGNIYVTGNTASTTGFATTGAYQTTGDSINGDAFIGKFGNCITPTVSPITGPTTLCALGTITLTDTATGGTWASSNTSLATISGGDVSGVAAGLDTITYSVTNGCGTTTVSYPVTVNAAPNVNPVTNQTVCAGDTTTAIHFTGTGSGTVYNWTCNNTSIGLAASGTGSIGSFTAVNTGNTPIVDTITVTPVAAGYAYIANGGDSTITVINTSTNAITATIVVGQAPAGVAVSPDGSKVYVTNSSSGSVSVISTATNTVVATVTVATSPYGIAVTPDGSKIYVACQYSDTVSVINASNNTVMAAINTGGNLYPFGVVVSPDGSKAYVTSNNSTGKVVIISTTSNTIISAINVGSQPQGIAVSPDGSSVYVANDNSNTVSVINTSTNIVTTNINVGHQPIGLAVSRDGSKVYVTNLAGHSVDVINAATNVVSDTIRVGPGPVGVSVSPGGSMLYVANEDSNSVSVINTLDNMVIATVPVGAYPYSLGNFITGGNGCTGAPTTFTIIVNPQPTASINGTATACGSVSLTATGGTAYTWSGGNTPNTAANTFNTSGTYTVTVSNGSSCTATAQQLVTVDTIPTVNSLTNKTACAGDSITYIHFTGTGTGTIYNWTCSNTSIGLAATGSGNIATFKAENTGSTPVTANVTVTPVSPPQGNAYIADYTSKTVSVINIATNQVTDTIHVGINPFGVAASPDGKRVYVGNTASPNISVINAITNQVIDTIIMAGNPFGIAVSLDNSRVYVANQNQNNITVINAVADTIIKTISLRHSPYGVAVSPDGSKVYVTFNLSDSVAVIDVATGQVAVTIPVGQNPVGVVVSPDGSQVYVANSSDATISVISTAFNFVSNTIYVTSQPDGLALSADGSTLYVAGSTIAGKVSVVNTATGLITDTIKVASVPYGISLSPDGSRLYVVNENDSSVFVFNTANNAFIDSIRVGRGPQSFGNFVSSAGGLVSCTGTPTTFSITVNPKPTAGITGTATACGHVSLTATGGTGYAWSGGNTPNTAANTFTATSTYTVTASNAYSCSATAQQAVIVNAYPVASITFSGPATFCVGDSVILTATAGNTYLWSNFAASQSITAQDSGTYYVIITGPAGCAVRDSAIVTVHALPMAAINGPTAICSGLQATLTASGGTGYSWSNGLGTNAQVNVQPTNNTTYTVTVTNANNCSATAQQTVSVTNAPTASITGPTQICYGYDVILYAHGGNTYTWSGGLGSADSIEDFPTQLTTYTVTVSIGANCSATASQVVNVYPEIFTYPLDTICAGQTYAFGNRTLNQSGTYNDTLQTVHGCDSVIILQLAVNNAAQTAISDTTCRGTSYIFNGHSLSESGIYKDTLQAASTCDSIVTLTLFVDSTATPTITRTGDSLQTQIFNSYQWLFNGAVVNGGTSQTLVVVQDGNYSVIVTGTTGCNDTSAVLNVTGLGISDVASGYGVRLYPNPNNGSFTLEFTDYETSDVSITDAIGRTIAATSKVIKQQNFNVSELSAGIYFLVINRDGAQRSLKFSIMR